MKISERVRAILITKSNQLLLIKRVREGFAPYWVAPGGGVETHDTSIENALTREIHEELGGTINIIKPVLFLEHILEEDVVIKQWFYLCYLMNYDISVRKMDTGELGRGVYQPDLIDLKPNVIKSLNIQPDKLKSFLINNHDHLLAMPAVRY